MKNKIVRIFVCTLIMVTAVSPASGMNAHPVWDMKETNNSEPCQREPTFSLGLITIEIVGTITDVSDDDNLFGGVIHIGDAITGKYIYNSRVSDSEPSSPEVGYYRYTSFPYGIEVNVGGFVFKTNPRDVNFEIWVYNNIIYYGNPPLDAFQVFSNKNLPLSNGMLVDYIVWELIDSTGTALSSDDLPTTAPVLTDWDYYYGMDLMLIGKDPSNTDKSYTIYIHITEATKNSAVDVNRDNSDQNKPSMTIPFQFNLHFKQFWMKLLERFPHTFPILRSLLRFNQ